MRAKKSDEIRRTVVFAQKVTKAEPAVRRYKNGVEVKPSEYTKEQ